MYLLFLTCDHSDLYPIRLKDIDENDTQFEELITKAIAATGIRNVSKCGYQIGHLQQID